MKVYAVTDGMEDTYAMFSTRELAQAWIDRQREQGYSWWDGLQIDEWELDIAEDFLASDP